ncbi:MAG: hypothetical protein GY786_24750, partial [Proteobacteria bacterium]|nr:hypothetical protein [Pseudomonadota bacterium]
NSCIYSPNYGTWHPANLPPTISDTSADQTIDHGVEIFPFAAVTLGDDYNTISLVVTFVDTSDDVNKGSFSTIPSGFDVSGDGRLTFASDSSPDVPASAQSDLRLLGYTPALDRVGGGLSETTTFTITASDGLDSTSDSTTTVIATNPNDTPTITGTLADQDVSHDAPILPFSNVTLGDLDGDDVSVDISFDPVINGSFSDLSGFTDNSDDTYTYAPDSVANAQAALRDLEFTPTLALESDPFEDSKTTTFTIELSDGTDTTSDNTTTVNSINTDNSVPTITGTTAVNATSHGVPIQPFQFVSIGEIDSNDKVSLIVTLDDMDKGEFTTLSGFDASGDGSYTFASDISPDTTTDAQNAIRGLFYTPALFRVPFGNAETTTFTITLSDGSDTTSDDTTTVVSSYSINTSPTITGTVADQPVNDDASIYPFSGVSIDDFDSDDVSITITLDDADKGAFTDLSGFDVSGDGRYTFASDTTTAAQTALQGLVFDPAVFRSDIGLTETTTFTISITDDTDTTTDATTTVVSTSVTVDLFTTGYPIIQDFSSDGFNITVNLEEPGAVYYTIQAENTPSPSPGNVIDGIDPSGDTAIKSGNITVGTADQDLSSTVSGLESDTIFDIYLITEDDEAEPNRQRNVTKVTATTTESSNNAPTAPALLSPADGSSITSPVTLSWSNSTDADGDDISYSISVCADVTFPGCTPTTWTFSEPTANYRDKPQDFSFSRVLYAESLEGEAPSNSNYEMWLFLLIMLSGLSYSALSGKLQRKYLFILILITLGIISCGPEEELESEDGITTKTFAIPDDFNLTSGTYYWKITASDGNGGDTDSDVFSFIIE